MTNGCSICDIRPAKVNGHCVNCQAKIDAERRAIAAANPPFWRYLVYRSEVVGIRRVNGTLRYEWLKREPYDDQGKLKLPAHVTIDLNRYVPGFDRAQIKAMKRVVQIAVGVPGSL